MSREMPNVCMRGRDDCTPLCNVVSDDEKDFVCGGLVNVEHRVLPQDSLRLCFCSTQTDTMYDMDVFDMLDTAEICTRAVTTQMRLEDEEQESDHVTAS